jgi:hypothetical protein
LIFIVSYFLASSLTPLQRRGENERLVSPSPCGEGAGGRGVLGKRIMLRLQRAKAQQDLWMSLYMRAKAQQDLWMSLYMRAKAQQDL